MRRWSVAWAVIPLCLIFTPVDASGQTNNLLQNSDANQGMQNWQAKGEATIEVAEDGNPVFVIRNAGTLSQVVVLPEKAVGQYALLIGRASSERIISDRAIAGLPTLYGYMLNGDPSAVRAYGALEGEYMSSRAKQRNEWVRLWGIFRVPVGTERISFMLSQELQPGVQHDDPPARFDDLGVYLFATEDEARAFVGPAAKSTAKRELEKNPTATPECTLTRAPAPYGIQLGISLEQVLELFPGSSQDTDVRRMLVKSRTTDMLGLTDLQIVPGRYDSDPKYADVKVLTLRFLDGRALSVHVRYSSSRWKNTDEFISKMSDALSLPAPDAWETLLPLGQKYLRCKGFEIRFFGTPVGIGSYIYLVDLAAEKTLIERQAARKR